MSIFKELLVTVCMCALFTTSALAQKRSTVSTKNDTTELREAVVSSRYMLGSKFKARNRTGSAYFVSPKEIAKFGYTDVNRMLGAVPGVNLYEEDGYGLRPNISIRGTSAERSERITLMEDGILCAPAPYAAPAAYYFPNAARMSAVEVLKGSSQVQYGPFTTGGAVNMVSTPIPYRFTAFTDLSYGSFNSLKSRSFIGGRHKHWGYLVEYLRYQSDGFKHYADDEKTKGFRRNDVIGKLMYQHFSNAGASHRVQLKVGFANEHSDETYVGLTASDFAKTPYLRYAGSRKDDMRTRHHQEVLSYAFNSGGSVRFTADLYNNYFFRNWYKLADVRIGDHKREIRSIKDVLEYPITNAPYLSLLKGETNRIGKALMLRANDRHYHSNGIQMKFNHTLFLGSGVLNTELGARLHHDDEKRLQQDDAYAMDNGKMSLYYAPPRGTQSNRITEADAFASYLLLKYVFHRFTLTTGVRYENVELHKTDYGKDDPNRTGKKRVETRNSAKALIPSLGLHYQISKPLSCFLGVHKGFAPPSAGLFQRAESSVNTELGFRLHWERLSAEVIGYYNKYSNMLGSDLAAAGGLGTLEQFNVGKAQVGGVEALLQCELFPKRWAVQFPLQVSYTFTATEMLNAFYSTAWGQVNPGDHIPYVNKHTLSVQGGLSYKIWETNVAVNYRGDMRTVPGQGLMVESEKVPAHTVIDATLKARVHPNVTLKLSVTNLLDKTYLASRNPSGLRPGMPRSIMVGTTIKL